MKSRLGIEAEVECMSKQEAWEFFIETTKRIRRMPKEKRKKCVEEAVDFLQQRHLERIKKN